MYIVLSKPNKHRVGMTSQKKQLEMVTKLNLLFCELARKNITFCAINFGPIRIWSCSAPIITIAFVD